MNFVSISGEVDSGGGNFQPFALSTSLGSLCDSLVNWIVEEELRVPFSPSLDPLRISGFANSDVEHWGEVCPYPRVHESLEKNFCWLGNPGVSQEFLM